MKLLLGANECPELKPLCRANKSIPNHCIANETHTNYGQSGKCPEDAISVAVIERQLQAKTPTSLAAFCSCHKVVIT